MSRILIAEDGYEYLNWFQRFLHDGFDWVRAGNSHEALAYVQQETWDAVFCDLRFDRVQPSTLLGKTDALVNQFGGDESKLVLHLQQNQGIYLLAAIRDAGVKIPVLLSHDFSDEPRRWARIDERFYPVNHIREPLVPADIATQLREMISQAGSVVEGIRGDGRSSGST